MSRLASLSPAALRAMFSPESNDSLLILMTVTGVGVASPIRLSDGYTHKFEYASSSTMTVTNIETKESYAHTLTSTDAVVRDALSADRTEAFYGVMSGGRPFLFLPVQISLPSEDASETTRCNVTIYDVSRRLIPIIRSISRSPNVDLDLALMSTPDTVEASFPGFLMGGVSYSAETVTAELTVESYVAEPFPAHTFTPSYFPGLF